MKGSNDLAPAFRAVEDDRTIELKGELQLGLEELAHPWRNFTLFQPIQPDLPDSKIGFGLKSSADLTHSIIRIFDYSIISQRLPRMHSDEIPPDQKFPDRRISPRDMTMRISHRPKRLNLSFSAILTDSVAMPAEIFEYPATRSVKTIGISLMVQPAFHVRWFISSWKE